MTAFSHTLRTMLLLWLCLCLVLVRTPASAAPQPSAPASSAPSGLLQPCPDPGFCFNSLDAKQRWAAQHHCTFKKVVCEDTETQPTGVVATAKAMGRFVDGLIAGLKEQLIDLGAFFKELLTHPRQTWDALKALGKLIIQDPKGAAQLFAAFLGPDALKLIECGAYDQGKVIGKYVSPFFALKVARLVARGSKLAEALARVKNLLLSPAEKARLGIHHVPSVRMPDGRSIFDEPDIKKRGVTAENKLGKNTPDAFPVIDIFNKTTGEVISIKTKSPTAGYWTKEGGLRDRLKGDLRELASFGENGKRISKNWEKGSPGYGGPPFEIDANQIT